MRSDEQLLQEMMQLAQQVGRNDPCWCGSGLKYKKCHLRRAKETPINIQELLDAFNDAFFGSEYCLHPNASLQVCDGGIIKAHTIQRNGGLNRIAKDYHVYTVNFDLLMRAQGSKE